MKIESLRALAHAKDLPAFITQHPYAVFVPVRIRRGRLLCLNPKGRTLWLEPSELSDVRVNPRTGTPVTGKRGQRFSPDGLLIGRTSECDIALVDYTVSKLHARFRYGFNDEPPTIEDLDSRNGTFVNDRRLEPKNPTNLASGDEVRFGRVTVQFLPARDFYDWLREKPLLQ